jgi:putative lipoic acid-binding regulatory protein
MDNNNSLIEFPCHFQIKVVGRNHASFSTELIEITRQYFRDFDETQMRTQLSREGTYMSASITVYAQDQATLDALYTALSAHPDVNMVL